MPLNVHKQHPLRDMASRRFFRIAVLLSVVLWLIMTGLLAWRGVPAIYGKAAVPLHYNVHIGVDDVGPWWRIFTVPVLGLIFLVTNSVLAAFFWSREAMLSHLVAAATVFVQLILLLAAVFILINTLSYA